MPEPYMIDEVVVIDQDGQTVGTFVIHPVTPEEVFRFFWLMASLDIDQMEWLGDAIAFGEHGKTTVEAALRALAMRAVVLEAMDDAIDNQGSGQYHADAT